MSNLILVQGAWHSSSCWELLLPHLQYASIKTWNRKGYTLNSYIESLAMLLKPKDNILVGHSFGGALITCLAEKFPKKIKRLIFIAGVLPHGNSILKSLSSTPSLLHQATKLHKRQLSLDLQLAKEMFYHDLNPNQREKAVSLLEKDEPLQPLATTFTNVAANVSRLYIHCLQDRVILPSLQQQFASGCEEAFLNTGHCPFYSAPKALASLLS